MFYLIPAHYSRYFKQAEQTEPGDPEIIFDWNELRDACKSFLDSIVIELCFPRAPYPKPILFQILHDAVEESPREAKRFPQQLWDAVGDLSVSLSCAAVVDTDMLSRVLMVYHTFVGLIGITTITGRAIARS